MSTPVWIKTLQRPEISALITPKVNKCDVQVAKTLTPLELIRKRSVYLTIYQLHTLKFP